MKGDGPLGRLLWRGVRALGGVLGPRRARATAAAVMRLGARSGDRWLRGVYRVSRHTSSIRHHWSSGYAPTGLVLHRNEVFRPAR